MRQAPVALTLAVAVAGSVPNAFAAPSARVRANQARVTPEALVAVRDEGHMRFVSAEATTIVDEGSMTGTIPGRGRVHFVYNGSPRVSASFSIRAAGGTLYGRATCTLHNPSSPTPSFRGALRIVGGSGRYAHAQGSGELFGVFHRRGYGLVVQALGRLRY